MYRAFILCDHHRTERHSAVSRHDMAAVHGVGPALLVAHPGRSARRKAVTQVSLGQMCWLSIRAFVTPKVAVFTEYKYTDSTFPLWRGVRAGGGI